MKDLYKKILEKPESYRRRLAFVITGIVGVIIFSVWLGMTYNSMQEILGPSKEEGEENPVPQKGKMPSLEDRATGRQVAPSDYSGNDIYQGRIEETEILNERDSYKENETNVNNQSDNSENEIKNEDEASETIYNSSY